VPQQENVGTAVGPIPAINDPQAARVAPAGPQLPPESRGTQTAWEHTHRELLVASEAHPQAAPPGSHAGSYFSPPSEIDEALRSSHYAVQVSMLAGRWREGGVFHRNAFGEGADDLLRHHLERGHIRPADQREVAVGRATPQTATGPGAKSYEALTADLNRRVQTQEQQIAQLRDENQRLKQQPAPSAAPTVQGVDPKVLAEKDKVLDGLTRELKAAREEADGLRARVADLEEQGAKKRR
jgi:hypothetical protein